MKKLLTEWREYLLTEQASPVEAFMQEYYSNSKAQDGMGFNLLASVGNLFCKNSGIQRQTEPRGYLL